MTGLTHQQVRNLIDTAVSSAEEMNLKVCIAIADSGANIQGFLRMNGAFLGSADVSQRKARTSVLFQCPTDAFGNVIEQEQLIGMDLSNGGLCAFGGGVPVYENEQFIGAIGVSGATAEQDAHIAWAAAKIIIKG